MVDKEIIDYIIVNVTMYAMLFSFATYIMIKLYVDKEIRVKKSIYVVPSVIGALIALLSLYDSLTGKVGMLGFLITNVVFLISLIVTNKIGKLKLELEEIVFMFVINIVITLLLIPVTGIIVPYVNTMDNGNRYIAELIAFEVIALYLMAKIITRNNLNKLRKLKGRIFKNGK